jgi:mannose-6-phosphate isomerase-like protein (cupin superfamily)
MDAELPRKIEKPWGHELIIAQTEKYAGKLLFVKKGYRLSLHYHDEKDETFYCLEGQAIVETEGASGEMAKTDITNDQCYRVAPKSKHRLQATEDTTLFEVSTPELDDVVRLDDDFGRAQPGGK